jgi:hypothetical protein
MRTFFEQQQEAAERMHQFLTDLHKEADGLPVQITQLHDSFQIHVIEETPEVITYMKKWMPSWRPSIR